MGVIEGNALFSMTTHRIKKVIIDKIIAAEKSQTFYRPAKNRLGKTQLNKPIAPLDGTESLRIQSLEKELLHYRFMLDKMVRQKTDRLNRRLAI